MPELSTNLTPPLTHKKPAQDNTNRSPQHPKQTNPSPNSPPNTRYTTHAKNARDQARIQAQGAACRLLRY